MKHILLLAILCLSAISLPAQALLLQSKGYLDVRTGKLIEPANILIENGLITAINPDALPDGTKRIDLDNAIILPGLMDMHVHLDADFIPGSAYLKVTESASKRTLRAARNAEKTLMAGFTTVRNIGQTHPSLELIDVALAEASDQAWIKAPHIVPCGHMIGISGGHADLSMSAGYAEGVMDLGPKYGIADGTDEALKATRYQIKHGAKAIKIMATAGVTTLEKSVGAQQLTFEEMKTIVDEAKRHGITVAAHAHGTEGILSAIKAGVTSIEHGSFLSAKAISFMKDKGTYLVPTMALLEIMKDKLDQLGPIMAAKGKEATEAAIVSHEKAIKAGVNIALGTDAPLVPHGQNGKEFRAMVDRGMKPLAAVQAGTINAAAMLGLKDRGEIAPGLLADLIAVELNPLADISTLERVLFVMKAGTIYKHE